MFKVGTRKAKGGHCVWVRKCDGEEIIVFQDESKSLAAVVRNIVSSLLAAVEWSFVPSPELAACLSWIDDEVGQRLEQVTGVCMDEDRLHKLHEHELAVRQSEDVQRLIEKAEIRTKLRLSLNPSAIRLREHDAAEYEPVPSQRVPVAMDGVLPPRSGVYFIWELGERIVYVGQSINLNNRVRLSHQNIEVGDWVSFVEVPTNELLFAEAYYIGTLRPRRNFGEFQRRLQLPPDAIIVAGEQDELSGMDVATTESDHGRQDAVGVVA